jgi:hypothetical protein
MEKFSPKKYKKKVSQKYSLLLPMRFKSCSLLISFFFDCSAWTVAVTNVRIFDEICWGRTIGLWWIYKMLLDLYCSED